MNTPQYITQLSRQEMSNILRSCNLEQGNGIKIEKKDNSIKLSIDGDYIKHAIWNFLHNGGQYMSADEVKYMQDL